MILPRTIAEKERTSMSRNLSLN